MRNEELHKFYLSPNAYFNNHIGEDEMSNTCSTYGRIYKLI
jgi:hypothetical protein